MASKQSLLGVDWHIQVRGNGGWQSVRPTGGKPYAFATRDDALSMASACYPYENPTTIRVVPA